MALGYALRTAALAAAALALGAGCVPAVRVALDEHPDLTACRTWAWRPAERPIPADLDVRLRGAIAAGLARRGFERARDDATACFLVGYELDRSQQLVMRTETGAQQRVEAFGSSGASGGTPGAFEVTGSQRRAVAYEAGVLELAVAEGAARRVVWRAYWRGRARDGLDEHLDEAVESLFESFPTGPAAAGR